MKQQNTKTPTPIVHDTLATDFYKSVVIVSLFANLAVFTAWLTAMVA